MGRCKKLVGQTHGGTIVEQSLHDPKAQPRALLIASCWC